MLARSRVQQRQVPRADMESAPTFPFANRSAVFSPPPSGREVAPQGRRERTLRLPEAFSIYVLRCRLALGIGGIRVGALALRRGLGRHDVGDLVGAVEVIVLLRVVRLGHQAAHLLDLRVGGRVAGQVNDIVAQVQLAGIDGTGVLAEVLVQQVRICLRAGYKSDWPLYCGPLMTGIWQIIILLESISAY